MNLLVIFSVFTALCVNMVISRKRSYKNLDKPLATSRQMCRSGDGSSYRGFVSTSADGKNCMKRITFENPQKSSSKEISYHNYCRNLDNSLMPWCYVKRRGRIVKEFCNIPRCPVPTPPTEIDTEMTCGQRSERRMNKIVGGSFAAIESQPWMAAIYRDRKFQCGGSLIAPCWVLTAAHCFHEQNEDPQHLFVHLGKTATNETDAKREQTFTVEKVILHHRFNISSSFDNDIALLKISGEDGKCAVKSASVRTVCLPPANTQLPVGFQCSIAGYGREKFSAWANSKHLKEAEVSLISRIDCTRESDYNLTNNMICAGSQDWTRDACKGDSGGPLVCDVSGRMFLFGVVSWGDGCAMKNKPGVYTKVSNYNRWITAETGLFKYTRGKMYPDKT
ncbi:tissue-type plasminogen activator-like [Cynoglossus semilaevis]|uniref:trypsin n=1 Tax=Cynoglossus semilaevis TaxID=244447 RepID=A0A3P8VIC7_CYNSE|nr:tissue-type plasminogen activator-like [Cynoglossus semilaevis]XP_008320247.1 tissue-type plasminogen activator-like [Cynoglossus semilaevis]